MRMWPVSICRNNKTNEYRMFDTERVPAGWTAFQATQVQYPVDSDNPNRCPLPKEGIKVTGKFPNAPGLEGT